LIVLFARGDREKEIEILVLIGRYWRPRLAICRAPRGMFCW